MDCGVDTPDYCMIASTGMMRTYSSLQTLQTLLLKGLFSCCESLMFSLNVFIIFIFFTFCIACAPVYIRGDF